MKKETVSIIIASCDKYKDIAQLYVKCIRANWPDCEFPIYVSTESIDCSEDSVITIKGGFDATWSERVVKTIESTDSKYIWLTVDDLFIVNKVENNKIDKVINMMEIENLKYYYFPPRRLHSSKKNIPYKNYEGVFKISKSAPYGVNMGTEIWEKEELIRVLNDGIETAWDVENYFLEKASHGEEGYYEDYVNGDGSIIKIAHGIKAGKWLKKGANELRKAGIYVDYNIRGYVPLSSTVRTIVVGTGNKICPPQYRASVKKVMSKLGMKFATKY